MYTYINVWGLFLLVMCSFCIVKKANSHMRCCCLSVGLARACINDGTKSEILPICTMIIDVFTEQYLTYLKTFCK